MMNHRVRKTRTGLVFGSLTALLLGAAALLTAPSAQGSDNVCETGFTSDPAYVRECMAHGTREDAAVAWFVVTQPPAHGRLPHGVAHRRHGVGGAGDAR